MLLGWSGDGRRQATGQMTEACGCMCLGDGVCSSLHYNKSQRGRSSLCWAPGDCPEQCFLPSLLNVTSADFMERKREGRYRKGGSEGQLEPPPREEPEV